ncbi:hypothetical protein [Paraburkholderia metrosideri]|nr:hypothetical protein [Paraburkholderia metrosideri]
MVVASVFAGVFGIVFLYLANSEMFYRMLDTGSESSNPRVVLQSLFVGAFFLFLVSAGSVALLYLQTGFRSELRLVSNAERVILPNREVVQSRSTAKIETPSVSKRNVVDDFGNLISSDIASPAEEDSPASVPPESIDGALSKDQLVELQFEQSRDRLLREITSLGWRGNVNLVLGILISVSGLSVLAVFLLSENGHVSVTAAAGATVNVATAARQSEEAVSFFIHFLPRLTFVLLIELFAYFFLRLYKNSLSEIKYFQNEITNLEAKHLALRSAFFTGTGSLINKVVVSLVETERNHILEKGQTTVELERTRIERDDLSDVTKSVSSLFEAVKEKVKK